jgi:hypothetical protein
MTLDEKIDGLVAELADECRLALMLKSISSQQVQIGY